MMKKIGGARMSSIYGISAYQQTNQTWSQTRKKEVSKTSDNKNVETTYTKDRNEIKKSEWKPIDVTGSLVPTSKEEIGLSIGEVQLSDKAKEYYNQLKSKFGNMEFIAVSQDMKSMVQANAAAYGNSNKQVVLIDDAKIEKMATDESYRKKYEGIIAMSQTQLGNAKNSLASSGANIKNFGMSVNSDGSTSFFATIEKSSDAQAKRLEKKQEEKRATKAKEKKRAEKKAKEEKLEKAREEKRAKAKEAEKEANEVNDTEPIENEDAKEYIKIEASSFDEILNKVSKYAYENSSKSVMTEEEKSIGQKYDFKG